MYPTTLATEYFGGILKLYVVWLTRRNKNDMILAIPPRMAQALVLFHRLLSLVVKGTKENDTDRCNGQTYGSPPA